MDGQWSLDNTLDIVWTSSQVLGGCCSNVYSLEKILVNNSNHSIGTVITFCQFAFVALISYFHNLDLGGSNSARFYLKQPNIPLQKWVISVIMFLTVSLINNMIWKYNISIPIHIVFRSGSIVSNMIIGYTFGGKKYNSMQVMSSFLVAFGTLIATMPSTVWYGSNTEWVKADSFLGIGLLLIASIMASFMGLYNEKLYRNYGSHWQESLFYSHVLALPFFALVYPMLATEFDSFRKTQMYYTIVGDIKVSVQVFHLLINVFTQYWCIRSVNKLSSSLSSLSVSMILLIRRFASLFLSVVIFNNDLSRRMIVGTFIVFLGSVQYTVGTMKYGQKKKRE